MLFSLYLLSILYTNTMGLIIIAKCKPLIIHEMELKGYKEIEKDDVQTVLNIFKNVLKFLIPGYFLNKAISLTSKDFNIDKLIDKYEKDGEIEKDRSNLINQTFLKRDTAKMKLSQGKYERKTSRELSGVNSMYASDRNYMSEEVDMDFWEEEEKQITPYIETEEEREIVINKEPIREYLDTITEEELKEMVNQLDKIRKLKKQNEEFLN